MRFVIARNWKGRPTLMHAVKGRNTTVCGQDIREWSKVWFEEPIDQLICRRCRRMA